MDSSSPFFPAVFVGMWVAIALVLSRLGWSDLASVYRTGRPFEGRRWHWVSAQVGKVGWRSSLTMGANGEGLFLAPMILFRIAHPPLFIRWSDISVAWKRWFGFECVQLTARGAPHAAIIVREPQARAIALAAGAAWPAPDLLAQIELRRATVDRGRTAAAYLAVGALVFTGVAVAIGGTNVPEYWKLERAGQLAVARITSVQPENHNSLRYAYTVGEARYVGIGWIDDAGPAPIRPGGALTIHYLPAEPSASCLGDPHAQLVDAVMSAGTGAIFMVVVALLLLRSLGFAVRRPATALSEPREPSG